LDWADCVAVDGGVLFALADDWSAKPRERTLRALEAAREVVGESVAVPVEKELDDHLLEQAVDEHLRLLRETLVAGPPEDRAGAGAACPPALRPPAGVDQRHPRAASVQVARGRLRAVRSAEEMDAAVAAHHGDVAPTDHGYPPDRGPG
jgi:hypothetical protein